MARSRFSHTEETTTREPVRNGEGASNSNVRQNGGETPKKLIWWSATYITLAILALIMICAWAMRQNGGFAWKDTSLMIGTLNYHPLMMICGFMLSSGVADILYRLCRQHNKLHVKIAHASIQIIGFCFVVAGLCAIFWYHDIKGSPHMQSAHSWIGILVVLLLSLQWVVGFFGLLVPGFRPPLRASYLSAHKFTGRCIFLLSLANILIGINKVAAGATVMNVLALIVILYAVNGGYLLSKDLWAYEAPGNGGGMGDRKASRHSNIQDVPTDVDPANMYINIQGTAGTGNYQSLADDPAVKDAMSVGRDTFNKFNERLQDRKKVEIPDIPTTTVAPQ